jgi:hypothetical protein
MGTELRREIDTKMYSLSHFLIVLEVPECAHIVYQHIPYGLYLKHK